MREFIVSFVCAIPVAVVVTCIIIYTLPDNFLLRLVAAVGLGVVYNSLVYRSG